MAINVNINVSNLGAAVLSQNNPAAQSWIRVETNGAITLRTAAETLSDLGAQAAGAYVTAVTASGNIASSGGTTPNITFTGVLPTANGGTAVNIATTALTLGTASSAAGSIVLQNATNANTITIQSGVTSSSHTLTLPVANASGVLTNDGAGALTWAAASSGITVGTTTITSGTSRRIGYNLAGVYQEALNELYFETASPFAHVFAAGRSQVITGVSNSFFGYQAGSSINTGQGNTGIGRTAACGYAADSYNTCVGYYTMNGNTGSRNVALGYEAMYGGANSYSIAIGYRSVGQHSSTIIIGTFAAYNHTTATHQGILGSNDANGYIDNWYYNGVTHTAPYSVTLNASGASGSNVAGCTYTHAGSKGTGSGTPGTLVFKTSTTLGSGTTLQSLVSRLTISGGAVTTDASTATWADALDFVFGTTTGTKIGTGTTQKIGFWNATPLAQQTTASAASTFVANTSLIANDTATFDGYTLGQVVKILRNLGILA